MYLGIFNIIVSTLKIQKKLSNYILAKGAGPSPGGGGLGELQPPPPQFLTDQLILSQPGVADYARHSTTSTPKFSDLTTGLVEHIFCTNDMTLISKILT